MLKILLFIYSNNTLLIFISIKSLLTPHSERTKISAETMHDEE